MSMAGVSVHYLFLGAVCALAFVGAVAWYRSGGNGGGKAVVLALLLLCTGKVAAFTFPADKVSHFSTGATIGTIGYSLTYKFTQSRAQSTAVSFGLMAFAAVGKELYDRRMFNSPRRESLKDLAWTTGGWATSVFVLRFTF